MFGFFKPKIPVDRLGNVLAEPIKISLNRRDAEIENGLTKLVEMGADPAMLRIEVGAFQTFSTLWSIKCGVPAGKLTGTKAEQIVNAFEREVRGALDDGELNTACEQRYGSTVFDLFMRRVGLYFSVVEERQQDPHAAQTVLVETFARYMVNGSPSQDELLASNFRPVERPVSAGLKLQCLTIFVTISGAVADMISTTRIA